MEKQFKDKLDLFESDSEIEFLVARKKKANIDRARHHWSLLRKSVRVTISAVSETDIKEVIISHGIHHVRKMNQSLCIQHVAMIDTRKEYISTDGKSFHIYLSDGRKKGHIIPEEPMNRILYSSQTEQFVGWQHKMDLFYLMDGDEMEIISQVRTPGKIYLATYNKNTGEVLAVGPYFIMTIAFRYGAHHLIPSKHIKTECGEENMFTMMALEDTASRSQRFYLALDHGIVVYNLYEGTMILHKKNLHVQRISALTFFNPLKYVITGSLDGSIKVWDEKWHVVMVFVGHCEKVNALAVCPFGPAVISASIDHTVRVWNLETCDEVDRVCIDETVDCLDTVQGYDTFYTFSGNKIDLWRIQHLYNIHTAVGYRVNGIKMTNHPFFPVRAVLACSDSSVRIVCPSSGDVITSLINDQFSGLVDVAYAIAEDVLFTVMGNGDIMKSRTDSNPCTVVSRWTNFKPGEICNYLLVYEYIVDVKAEGDIWEAMKRGATTHSVKNLSEPTTKSSNRNRTLLLGGRRDGYICLLNWNTGSVDFKIEAHGSKGVLNMIANSKQDQLISAGMDNVIKIWRLYPFAEEALAPLMSFYCGHTPVHMSTMKSSLYVAFQDANTATFSTVLYNLDDKNRFDHRPDDDHTDVITGVTVCQRMKLFASSGLDGTIRIWNESNTLIRLLKLNVIPYSIGFCNSRGDILVGIGRHLFKIPYQSYMPRAYKFKMVTMNFVDAKPEKPLEYDDNLLNRLSKNDLKRLMNSRSAFKFDSYVDKLTPEEEDAVKKASEVREQAFGKLFKRENELKELKEGRIKSNKNPTKSQAMKNEAFDNYIKIFYDKPEIKIPDEERFPEDLVNNRLAGSPDVEREVFKPETEPTGFFPKSILKTSKTYELPRKILPGGFVPNSVLAKVLFPEECSTHSKEVHTKYEPPSLTQDQLQQINEFSPRLESKQPPQKAVTFHSNENPEDVVNIGDSPHSSPSPSSPAPSNKSEEEAFWGKTKPCTPTPVTNKFQELLEKPQKEEDTLDISNDSQVVKQDSVSTMKSEVKPVKPIAKLISRPAPVLPSSPPAPIPTPPASTPSPAIQEVLPEFFTQFEGTEWFKKYFSNWNQATWPKPWTADSFALSMLKALRVAEFPLKTAITEALILVNVQEGFSDSLCQIACRTFISILNQEKGAPSCAVDKEKNFILTSIRALNCLSTKDNGFIIELIIQYLDGDWDIRALICDILVNCGLQDPHRQLEKELDSWDIWNLEEEDRKSDLRNMCYQWLERWMTSYKIHIEDTIEKMKKGQNIQSRITKSQLQRHQMKAKKKGSTVSVLDDQATYTTLPDGTEFVPRHNECDRSSQHSATSSLRSFTLTYGKLPEGNLSDSANYIDAINYFCEMMVEKEMEALKRGQSSKSQLKASDKLTQSKNTVLVLPRLPRKQALVRLGESHTLGSKGQKDSLSFKNVCLPPVIQRSKHNVPGQIKRFVPAINLPLKTVYMNPFPNPLDKLDARFQEPILITLRSEQKFFCPTDSIVPSEFSVALSS